MSDYISREAALEKVVEVKHRGPERVCMAQIHQGKRLEGYHRRRCHTDPEDGNRRRIGWIPHIQRAVPSSRHTVQCDMQFDAGKSMEVKTT